MKITQSALILSILALSAAAPVQAQSNCCQTYEQLSGRRSYRLYPYTYSYGNRVDPYWSYTASYFPYTYQGDGSYYGLGYSGYQGRGAHGNYWYW